MVFAVWAAQRDCDAGALARIDRALSGAVAEASEHADLVARAAGERHGFPAGYLARYFEKLRYGFGERERAGLERFYALAAERGAIAGTPELRFADTARVR
jgi:predicted solute-binding protein